VFVPRSSTTEHRSALFAEAMAIIEADHARELTLDEVARRIATSRRQLQRVFRDVGETSFRECLVTIRLRRAAVLLAQGMPIPEVSARVGYAHPSHFARAFRRQHGVSPSAFGRHGGRQVVYLSSPWPSLRVPILSKTRKMAE